MNRLFHLIRNDRRGTATIELALLAPLLATFIIGVVDLTNAFSRKLAMEQAAQRGIEKIMQTTTDTTVDETIVGEAADGAGVDESQVVLDYWLECDGTRKANYDTDTCTGAENEARYITLTITDSYDPMFAVHFAGINADGTYHLKAESGIRIK
jgi:Flp pilus assembly pilin Flp